MSINSAINLNFFDNLISRFKIAVLAFKQAPSLKPIIKLDDGTYIDLKQRLIVLPEETHIHCKETLRITSDKHLIFSSGRDDEGDRPGYIHSIWHNTDLDEYNRPLRIITVYDANGKSQSVVFNVDPLNGRVIIPDGFYLTSPNDGISGTPI